MRRRIRVASRRGDLVNVATVLKFRRFLHLEECATHLVENIFGAIAIQI